jgi:prophage antirepressor-like protein
LLELNQSAVVNFDSDLYGTLNVWTDEKGREFFKALDVCSALKLGNVSQSLKRYVDPEYVVQFNDGSHRGGKTNYLSEPGLYQIIFAAKTDWAKQFQKWVFEEVLPKLRADGGYIMPNATSEQIRALTGKFNYLSQKHRREIYPLFKEIAELNAPKLKPVGRHRTNGERNADFLAQREIYFQCWDAWEASEHRTKVKVTLEEADQFLPTDLARPWGRLSFDQQGRLK